MFPYNPFIVRVVSVHLGSPCRELCEADCGRPPCHRRFISCSVHHSCLAEIKASDSCVCSLLGLAVHACDPSICERLRWSLTCTLASGASLWRKRYKMSACRTQWVKTTCFSGQCVLGDRPDWHWRKAGVLAGDRHRLPLLLI